MLPHAAQSPAQSSRLARLLMLCLLAVAVLAAGAAGPRRTSADAPPALGPDDEAWVVQTAAQIYNSNRDSPDYRGLDATSLQQPLRACLLFAQANTTFDGSRQRTNCQLQVQTSLIFNDPSNALDAAVSAEGAPLVDLLPPDAVQTFVTTLRQCLAADAIGRVNGGVSGLPRSTCPDPYVAVDQGWIDGVTPTFLAGIPTDQFPNFDAAKTEADFRACLRTALSSLFAYADALQSCTQQTLQHLLTPPPVILSLGCPGTVADGQGFQCTPSFDPASTVTGTKWTIIGSGSSGDALQSLSDTNPTFAGLGYVVGGYTITLTACNDNPSSCTTQSQGVMTELAAPVVGAPGCPDSAFANKAITCTASGVSQTYPSTTWTWTATNGAPDKGSTQGEASTVSVTFSAAGQQTVTTTACNVANPPKCVTVTQTVTVDAVTPTIATIGCNPQSGSPPLMVTCSATISDGKTSQTTETWSTSGGTANSGSGDNFATAYQQPGNYTITFMACNGSACTDETFTISVNAPQAPKLGPLNCAPPFPLTGDQITCRVSVDPSTPVTSYAWSAPGGTPPSGTASSFTTSFSNAGPITITVNACNGSACSMQSASAVIGARSMNATLNGTISVTEGDIGCAFSAMPASGGSITISVTFPPGQGGATSAGTATGHLSGGGGGSRTVHCNGGSGTLTWSANYSADFTGTVDPSSGAITLNGTMHVTQSLHASNCTDSSGKSTSCDQPGFSPSTSYPVHVTGTYNSTAGSGSGSLVMDSGCSTAGTWNASK